MTPSSEESSGPSVDRMIEQGFDPHRKRRVPVPVRLVAALAGLIGLGTALLLLPGMTTRPITFMDALFTATSAAAVTGLAVLSTSTDFTRLGQWVILLLMQVGGLGFLVTLVLTVRLLGRRVSLMDRLAVSSSLGLGQHPGHPADPVAHGALHARGRGRRRADPLGALAPEQHRAGGQRRVLRAVSCRGGVLQCRVRPVLWAAAVSGGPPERPDFAADAGSAGDHRRAGHPRVHRAAQPPHRAPGSPAAGPLEPANAAGGVVGSHPDRGGLGGAAGR